MCLIVLVPLNYTHKHPVGCILRTSLSSASACNSYFFSRSFLNGNLMGIRFISSRGSLSYIATSWIWHRLPLLTSFKCLSLTRPPHETSKTHRAREMPSISISSVHFVMEKATEPQEIRWIPWDWHGMMYRRNTSSFHYCFTTQRSLRVFSLPVEIEFLVIFLVIASRCRL